ncbi:DMT family transporter [Modicisalibacter radicis]|uniref:DMT family transporter n=1 Tax=Halomonas sp. EAR18 TaxID=2518972 RepID=UPI00109D30F2|nr:DMT family transporter [Halomonas sp. EAR18]
MTGIPWIIAAAALWGVAGGLAGILIEHGWEPLVVAFYQAAIGFLCLCAWLCLQPGEGLRSNRNQLFWAVLAGVGIAGNFALYFLSIRHANVAVAATLMYTAPVYVYLVAFIAGLERNSLITWLCLALVLVGVVLLTGVTGAGGLTAFGIACGIGAGLAYALFIFGFKYASLQGRPHLVLVVAFLTVLACLFPFIDHAQAVAALRSADIGWFVLLGLFGVGLSFLLYIVGLRRTSPTVASIIAMVEPVTASWFGIVVLGTTLGPAQALGMAIILVTVTYLSVRQR